MEGGERGEEGGESEQLEAEGEGEEELGAERMSVAWEDCVYVACYQSNLGGPVLPTPMDVGMKELGVVK